MTPVAWGLLNPLAWGCSVEPRMRNLHNIREGRMGTMTENRCLRCREDCTPLANLSADEQGSSFICVGYNRLAVRTVQQDRFTLCWKNKAVDERGFWDRRDLLDTMSVIAQAVSTDENIRVSSGMSDDEMNLTELLP